MFAELSALSTIVQNITKYRLHAILMENFTSASYRDSFNFIPGLWISDVIICTFLAVISLYLFIALLCFHHKKVERPSIRNFWSLSSEWKHRVLCFYICVCIGFVSIFRHAYAIASLALVGQVVYNNLRLPNQTGDVMCDVLPRLDVFAHGVCTSLVMLFLWIRQRTFYRYSNLQWKYFKCCKGFSYAVAIMFIILDIYLCIVYMTKMRYRYVAGNCLIEMDWGKAYVLLIFPSFYIPFILQLCLLLLFVCPLKALRAHQKREGLLHNQLDSINIKAIWLAVLCVYTDDVVFPLFTELYEKLSVTPFFPLNISLVIYHLTTIVSFYCWREMLWPWKIKSRVRDFVNETSDQTTVLPSDICHAITNFGDHTSIREIGSSS